MLPILHLSTILFPLLHVSVKTIRDLKGWEEGLGNGMQRVIGVGVGVEGWVGVKTCRRRWEGLEGGGSGWVVWVK
jgi:hypothetical protein